MSETLPALAARGPDELIEWGKNAIERAASFIAVKQIRDQAEALRAYQQSVGAAQEAVDAAQEIRARAERRMGQEIDRAQREGSAATPHRRQKGSPAVTLSEIGVTKKQSSDWQQLAAVDDEVFDATLGTARERGKLTLSTVRGLLRARRPKAAPPAKGKRGKARRERAAWKPPTPEEQTRAKVGGFAYRVASLARQIEELGTPEEVLALTAGPFDQPGRVYFHPESLYRVADFLTALAAAVEAEAGPP